ncbi:MAG: ABC transporter permease [candidate division WOR-3 bacterium]|nr:ABC transporter permease [candidate division WOR-3 bacterium]
MIERVSGVALNTFRESVRDKVLVTLVAFAVLVMGSARVIQPLALGEEAKVIKDMGLSAITLFCVLISILMGGRIVYKEVEKRTIYIMLAKPVRRWEFILGKYLGLMAVLVVSLAVMTAAFYAILLILGVGVEAYLLLAILMTFFELAILTAVAVLFSTFSTPITGAVFTFAIYFVGNLTRDLKLLAAMSPSVVVKVVSQFLYYVLPNFSNFNIRAEVVYGAVLDPDALLLSGLYALVYTATLLLISAAIFNRKEF